jgi:O-methyltransferase
MSLYICPTCGMANDSIITTLRHKSWCSINKAIERIRPYTELDDERLTSLVQCVFELDATQGNIVECGVARGGSAAILAWASGRHCWLYDSMQGLPEPSKVDTPTNPAHPSAASYVGGNETSPEIVASAFQALKLLPSCYTLHAGWFEDTFALPGPDKIALLHIDADWYDSVLLCLDAWYDKVNPGGFIVLDDYGYWDGCRLAYEQFCRQRNIGPNLHRVSAEQAWWRK